MKKKLAIVLVACACIGLLSACGGSTEKKVSDGSSSSSNTSSESSTTSNGYAFEAGGAKLVIDSEFEQYKSALGEETSCYEAPSCAFGDLDKIWTYSGFEVNTYQVDGVDYISTVVLKDDTVSTPEGVSIGDSADDVIAKYGEASTQDASQIVYEKDSMKLIFMLSSDAVSQIQYKTTKF